VYRYVPPEQVIARAVTYIGDVLLEFALTFTGSLTVICSPDEASAATEEKPTLQVAGAALHRIADGLYISAVKADRPVIESAGGHRFTHATSTSLGPRTRRFAGECTILIPGGGAGKPAIAGSLGYTLDITAARPSDPPVQDGVSMWDEHYDRTLASIGAVVLAPVPVAANRAARLYAT
jgi:hypothetical protein